MSRVPSDVGDLFPRMIGSPEFQSETYSLRMEKVTGVACSLLLINRGFSNYRLEKIVAGLKRLHESSGNCENTVELCDRYKALFSDSKTHHSSISIYCNYADKVKSRYEKHQTDIYSTLGEEIPAFYNFLMSKLEAYEKNDQGTRCNVIHGDPILSNIIWTVSGDVKFIDMRGRVGESFITAGDCMYDLAKLYQSLIGYEYISLADEAGLEQAKKVRDVIPERDWEILCELQGVFERFVEREYGVDAVEKVKLLTAGLLFSLLPYHETFKWKFYMEMSMGIAL
jgi:thiamine kinase-like enzyme